MIRNLKVTRSSAIAEASRLTTSVTAVDRLTPTVTLNTTCVNFTYEIVNTWNYASTMCLKSWTATVNMI